MVYKNDKSLNYLLFEEGLVNKGTSAYAYEYHIKDHLGNTRVAFQPNGSSTTLTQVAEYYPFGSTYLPIYNGSGTSNKYLYNGKEKQDDVLGTGSTALDWYDYGARFFDPKIGRWNTLDPQLEKYSRWSPYNYVMDNPIRNIDPKGDTVRVDPSSSMQFKKDYSSARKLLHDKGVDAEVTQLENSKAVYTVRKTNQTNGKFVVNKDKNGNYIVGGVIKWNPAVGFENNNGTLVSPTTILNHEFGHAQGDDSDPVVYQIRVNIPNAQYGDNEEERVITGVEQRTALGLGEIEPGQVTRTDHLFKQPILTISPTSNQGVPTMIQMEMNGFEITTPRPKSVNPKYDQ